MDLLLPSTAAVVAMAPHLAQAPRCMGSRNSSSSQRTQRCPTLAPNSPSPSLSLSPSPSLSPAVSHRSRRPASPFSSPLVPPPPRPIFRSSSAILFYFIV
jgi:hypothetical protein